MQPERVATTDTGVERANAAERIGWLRMRYIRLLRRFEVARHEVRTRSEASRIARVLRNGDGPRAKRSTIAIALIEQMGDIVACEPVARYLRAREPDSRLLWIVRERYRSLVEHNPSLDGVIEASCPCVVRILEQRGVVDEMVTLHPGEWCVAIEREVRRLTKDPRINRDNYYEFGGILKSFCLSATLPPLDEEPRLHMPRGVGEVVDRLALPPRFAVFHCQASERTRDWDDGKWRRLRDLLREEFGLAVVEVGLSPTLRGDGTPDFLDLCGRLQILETAEVIRRAAVFVGIDSGPAHLANAVGTDGVILVGLYKRFTRYIPYSGGYADGSRADVLQSAGPAADLTVEEVATAVRRRLTPPSRTAPRPPA